MEEVDDNKDAIPEDWAAKIPEALAALIPKTEEWSKSDRDKWETILMCKSCKEHVTDCELILEENFCNLDPCAYVLSCSNPLCRGKEKTWYSCFKHVFRSPNKNRLQTHMKNQKLHAKEEKHETPSRKRTRDGRDVIEDDSWPAWDMSSDGDRWLKKVLESKDKASNDEIEKIFPEKHLQNMHHYWIGEHNTPGGDHRRFGGMRYLVARAFQKTWRLVAERMPSFPETKFHFQGLLQFLDSSLKQRERAAVQFETLVPLLKMGGETDFFRNTRLPSLKTINTLYGFQGRDCMWQHLPIPPVENIDGIAYMKPIYILRHAFAMGIEFDLDEVKKDTEMPAIEPIGQEACRHIHDCNAFKEMKKGAVEAIREDSFPYPFVLLVAAFDWRDGFGANRTKQNRKSVDVWSLTLAPPRNKINTANNTFAVAVGRKSSSSWKKVEHKYRMDMMEISDPKKPVLVYHGKLKKIFPVTVKILASLEDKPERADVTDTLGHSSDYCRRFRVACYFKPLECKPETNSFVEQRALGLQDANLGFGWSSNFVQPDDKGTNTERLPACYRCRGNRIKLLKSLTMGNKNSDVVSGYGAPSGCPECADWDMDTPTNREMLSFPAPPGYPMRCAPGGPDPPLGREVGLQRLQAVDLTFPFLCQAAKFIFYNFSRRGKKSGTNWTKTTGELYSRTCGINKNCFLEIYETAYSIRESNVEVDYSDTSTSLAGYELKASWLGSNGIDRHIELLMHQFFLGLASGNFWLTTDWLKDKCNEDSDEGFRKSAQPLLEYVRKFHLSWLEVHPFNEGNKKTTGAWVSENWLAWVRLSKVTYGWCYRKGEHSVRCGSNDVQRLVISFVALVAQLLTHNGIARENIILIDCYIKEFMSCVRELDILVRRNQIGKKGKKDTMNQAWYMKSNYFSLFNVVHMVETFGALINLWDGGGKGERFIQLVKPHIPRGVTDLNTFFERLMERVYKTCFLNYNDIANNADKMRDDVAEAEDKPEYIIDDSGLIRLSDDLLEDDDNRTAASSQGDTNTDVGDNADSDSGDEEENDPVAFRKEFSFTEDRQMMKTRTIYIYSRKHLLEKAIQDCEPISGIIMKETNDSNASFVLYCVYRAANKSFGWAKIDFEDDKGYNYGGLYYAPIVPDYEEMSSPRQSVEEIKESAFMSAVAIPMRYAIGGDDEKKDPPPPKGPKKKESKTISRRNIQEKC